MRLWVLLIVCVASSAAAVRRLGGDDDEDDNDMLTITILYQSHCEECEDFFASKLQPIFCKIKEYVILELVPFGNSHRPRGFICNRGMRICRGNTIQNCVLPRISDPIAQLDYVTCALSDPDLPRYINHVCLDKHNISKFEMEQCATSQEGSHLMIRAEKRTKRFIRGRLQLPTIIFDDIYDDYDQWNALLDLESMICRKLENHGYGDVCIGGVILHSKHCERTSVRKNNTKTYAENLLEPYHF